MATALRDDPLVVAALHAARAWCVLALLAALFLASAGASWLGGMLAHHWPGQWPGALFGVAPLAVACCTAALASWGALRIADTRGWGRAGLRGPWRRPTVALLLAFSGSVMALTAALAASGAPWCGGVHPGACAAALLLPGIGLPGCLAWIAVRMRPRAGGADRPSGGPGRVRAALAALIVLVAAAGASIPAQPWDVPP
ncbi:MAG: hypothetical protein MPI95_06820 [Nitrosopumilus sp.]|nr:hypothetical protein [Nitrosopumilus sp.]MDA7958780.1 hypothetical protein [Nitrosopumilus sp.]